MQKSMGDILTQTTTRAHPLLLSSGSISGMNLCRLCACCHIFSEFIYSSFLLNLWDAVFLESFTVLMPPGEKSRKPFFFTLTAIMNTSDMHFLNIMIQICLSELHSANLHYRLTFKPFNFYNRTDKICLKIWFCFLFRFCFLGWKITNYYISFVTHCKNRLCCSSNWFEHLKISVISLTACLRNAETKEKELF